MNYSTGAVITLSIEKIKYNRAVGKHFTHKKNRHKACFLGAGNRT